MGAALPQVDGLRLAHVDEGDGPPVVMWHGEPTWSFLWRKVAPPLLDAGHRVVLPDLAGFGRSDKPIDVDWYSYDRHVAVGASLLEDLDLRGATFVVHDWGGPIGLRLAVEHPERVDRLVVMDTGLFTGRSADERRLARVRRLRASAPRTCRSACSCGAAATPTRATRSPPPTTRRSPARRRKAGARAFPALILPPARRAGRRGGRARAGRAAGGPPAVLMLWGAAGPGRCRRRSGEAFASALGTPGAPAVIERAGHFLQEDRAALVGAAIADWLDS